MKCVKAQLFLLTTSLFIIFISCVDYCTLEKKICKKLKHVGCESNDFNNTMKLYTTQPMTPLLKRYILNELNVFRSDVAIGEYIKDGLPKSANMRSIRWNNEFEYLANLSINKIPFADFSGCADTEEFHNVFEYHFSQYGIYTGEKLFHDVLSSRTSESKNKTKQAAKFYIGKNYQIGCAFGSLIDEDGDTENIVKCIQNEWSEETVDESYSIGETCSKCSIYNEICDDDKYPGLCVPEKDKENIVNKGDSGEKGEKGDKGDSGERGEKGDRGDNEFKYPLSFWFLYILLVIGVIVSILISMKLIPFINKRSYPIINQMEVNYE